MDGEDTDEILASLEKEAADVCYHQPSSPVEQRLANMLASLIAVIRHERAKAPTPLDPAPT